MSTRYDVVIVGAGSAGCTLANRLSADPGTRVLLLESGHPDHSWDVLVRMPGALAFPLGRSRYDWRHETEPEPHLHNRRLPLAAGRMVGGSSTINGMIFQRGNPLDFQRWAAEPGLDGWGYADVLPYFRRMENSRTASAFRGRGGPVTVERGAATHPLFRAFLLAGEQAGYPATDDVNGFRQEGFGRFDRTISRSRRWSASRAYLDPARRRPNLTVRTGVDVRRVLFDGTRAIGVELTARRGLTGRSGSVERVHGAEIVLCAGAIKSPQLLQLSGIGDARRLRDAGVRAVHDLPGVGEGLQDHLEVMVQHACRLPVSLGPTAAMRNAPWIGFQWLFLHSGPGATNHFEAGGFVRGNAAAEQPNIMFQFLPLAVRSYDTSPTDRHGYQLHVGPVTSAARGHVRITSADPTVAPAIRFNHLSTEQDRRDWLDAIRISRDILAQPAFAPFNGGETAPGPAVRTDAEILDWVARHGISAMHYTGSCPMGTGPDAVVDPATMRVHGVDGLRVVDASVMPHITNANTNAPVMMIAEKAADLIMGRPAPAPEHEPFHRAQRPLRDRVPTA